MLDLVAERGCGYVLMHIEGPPRADREPPGHRDPVAHLKRWFGERIQAALERGVAEEQIALDPGLDFDLSVDDDLEILRRLGELRELGRPLFVALSRKDFLGAVLAGSWDGPGAGRRARVGDRRGHGAGRRRRARRCVRLHDRSALDALRTAAAISGRRATTGATLADREWLDPGAGLAAATGWERAIEPGRADGRLVAESLEAARTADTVEIPDRPGARAGGRPARERDRGALLTPARGARGGRRRATRSSPAAPRRASRCPSTSRSSTSWSRDDGHRALYLYPTKALAQDQARKLSALGLPQLRHAIYDGDTPRDDRPQIRRRSNLILTNPDMLHVGHPAPPQELGGLPRQPGLGGRGRGPHLPGRVRVARRQRPAPAAAGRAACTGPAPGSSSPRPRSPTRWSSPSGWSASPSAWSTPTALRAPAGGSGSGTRRSSTRGR